MMKHLIGCLLMAFGCQLFAQDITGAWQNITEDSTGRKVKCVVILTERHQVATWYDAEDGAFISCNGGLWSQEGNTITETVEFDTENPERVGSTVSFTYALEGNELKTDVGINFTRIDDGKPGELFGAWLISGRMRDGQIQERETNRPRKTMKILSGTRFQWIAYNTATKEFMGTGGGSYTTIDGVYTENIEFFSRDNSRVGASLEFNFEVKDGKWHHSGNNSRGEPMYEVWSRRIF